jgi:uncharacterized short protein YbdD (DUF466 family)
MPDGSRIRVAAAFRLLRETAHLMVGMPDYSRYVAHRLARHPGAAVMTRAEFARERTARRYEGAAPGRCC